MMIFENYLGRYRSKKIIEDVLTRRLTYLDPSALRDISEAILEIEDQDRPGRVPTSTRQLKPACGL